MVTILGFVSLTNPLLLGGMALLSLPIAAHLLNRFARRRIVFPSIELLQEAAASESRLLKLRRWLLLLLRCLMVAALVAAFTRPVWLQSRQAAANASQGNGVVIVLDVSASMQLERNGISLMELAKGAASRVVGQLRAGQDVADVVFAANEPHAAFDQLSPNLPALGAEIQRTAATHGSADGLAACRVAGRLLASHQGPRRLLIVSDMQATNWSGLLQPSKLRDLLPAETQVTVVDLKRIDGQNISLSRPRSFPSRPLAGQPVEFIVQVRNGTSARKQVRVSATVDDQSLPAQVVVLGGGEHRDVTFASQVEASGVHEIAFRTADDALRCDNECFLVAQTVQQLKVAIVSDDGPDRVGSGAYFVSRALAPYQGAADRYEINYLSSRNVTPEALARASTVFVGYLGQLTRPVAQRLLDYVRQGGGLVVFCGEGGVRRNLLVMNDLETDGLLPWLPGPRFDLSQSDGAFISSGKWRSPLLRDFDEASQIALGDIRFGTIWQASEVRGDAEVLLSYDNGTPALASRQIELGQIVMANFSPSAESSDLAKYGAFVALTQMLVKNLQPRDSQTGSGYVGHTQVEELMSAGESAANLEVEDPHGEVATASVAVRGESILVQLARPDDPGIYRVRSGTETAGAFAVNVDPRESVLETLSAALLEQSLEQIGDGQSVHVDADLNDAIDLKGQPLWGWLVALSMTLAATELFLLGRWRR